MDERFLKFDNGIMKVSIIIPVYNVAPYIEECLNSVIAQTYKGEMECILVDDCGTDDSMEICERIISKYNGPISFRLVHHKHNRGLSAARNTGIDASTGDWLYFLDSDDSLIPECIELMEGCLEKYPESEMVFAGAKSSDGSLDKMLDYENKSLPLYANNPLWIKRSMLFFVLNSTAWNKLVNKHLLSVNHCFFAEGYIHEDEIWNFELARFLTRIAICPHNTYQYLVRDNSIMTSKDTRHKFENRIKQFNKQIDIIPQVDRQYYIKSLWQQLIAFYRSNKEERSRQKIQETLGKLLKKSTLDMFPAVFLSYIMPYWFLKLRIINWFFSKFDKIPQEVNPIV